MAELKTIEEWEKEKGMFFNKVPALTNKISEKEYQDLVFESGYTIVDYPQRVAWLEANGYEITRPNLFDYALPPVVSKEEE